MFPRFSVKRPYTVIVGVIMVLILGYVSVTDMTADLLPSIELPYSIVTTVFAGASPEEVEGSVTRPVESAMATVSNIKTINSISSENFSMVILEFEESANMDSVNLEMREKLDQTAAGWEDGIGNPMIININPDMLPVMVAAVSREGYSGAHLNDYVQDDILAELESIEGVASVSASGGVTETIEVTISRQKLEAVNGKVRQVISDKFTEAREELEKARAEIEDGLKKVEDGETEVEEALEKLSDGNSELAKRMAEARAEVDSKKSELANAKLQLTVKLSELQTQKAQLQQMKTTVEQLKKARDTLVKQIKEAQKSLKSLQDMIKSYNSARTKMQALEKAIAEIEANKDLTPEQKEEAIQAIRTGADYVSAEQNLQAIEKALAAQGLSPELLQTQSTQMEATLETLQASLKQLDENIKPYAKDPADLDKTIKEIKNGLKQIEKGEKTINKTLKQLEEGTAGIREAEEEIDKSESDAYYQIYSAMSQAMSGKQTLEATKAQLESALAQLDASADQIDTQEEDAMDKADLTGVVTRDMVGKILTAQNFAMPAGYIGDEDSQMLVRVGNRFSKQEELAGLVIVDLDMEGLEPVMLSDVADVLLVNDADSVYASIDGEPGILLTMQKQTGYSTGDVANSIKEHFKSLEGEIDGLSFSVLMDQGIYIDFVVSSVFNNLLIGAGLAILILLLFLRDIRPTFVIALAIPISLTAAVALMYFSNISLNVISLSGLALGVGMLVDNSIVVTENIYRMRSEGVPPAKAAVEGAREVSGAILASTLTTCCVFLPIVFTEGLTKQLFTDLGLTITYSLMASLLVALTLVPVMGRGFLAKISKRENRSYGSLSRGYSHVVKWALGHRALILILSLGMLAGSAYLAYQNGTSLFPSMETTQVTVTLTPPEGSTIPEAAALSDQVIERIMTIDDVETAGAMIGSESALLGLDIGSGGSSHSATIYIILKEDQTLSNSQVKEEILRLTQDIDCTLSIETSSMDMSMLGASGVSVQIRGRDMDRLQELAGDFAEKLGQIEGITDVSDGMARTTPELRIVVDKAAAIRHDLTVAQVFAAVYAKLSTSTTSTTLTGESKDFPVIVLDGEAETFDPIDVVSMELTVTNQDGTTKQVKLADVAEFELSQGLSTIRRVDQRRTITVSAKVDGEHNIGLIGNDIEKLIDSYELPDGYDFRISGENEQINTTMKQLVKMMILAVIFVYLVMVAQFQSLLMPFIIMFTLPLAFTGGFLALVITGFDLSVVAMIGLIMLTGIIVNNGIVLVDYINILRRQGMEKREAIIRASGLRLRPILMTSLTTILGLTAMAFGMGMGADLVQPMAVVTIGGLTYGTLTTLLVMPCMYDLLSRKKDMTEVDPDAPAAPLEHGAKVITEVE